MNLPLMTEEPQWVPVLAFGEIRLVHQDRLGFDDVAAWPEITQSMENLMKDELKALKDILKGIEGVRSIAEFQMARRELANDQTSVRETALKKKAEKSLPGKDHHTAEVNRAEIDISGDSMEVTISLDIVVPGYQIKDFRFNCRQPYCVNSPCVPGPYPRPDDDDNMSAHTDRSSNLGVGLTPDQTEKTERSFTGNSGVGTLDNSQQDPVGSFGTSGA